MVPAPNLSRDVTLWGAYAGSSVLMASLISVLVSYWDTTMVPQIPNTVLRALPTLDLLSCLAHTLEALGNFVLPYLT